MRTAMNLALRLGLTLEAVLSMPNYEAELWIAHLAPPDDDPGDTSIMSGIAD